MNLLEALLAVRFLDFSDLGAVLLLLLLGLLLGDELGHAFVQVFFKLLFIARFLDQSLQITDSLLILLLLSVGMGSSEKGFGILGVDLGQHIVGIREGAGLLVQQVESQ